MKGFLPFNDRSLPLDDWIETLVEWLVTNYREYFQIVKWPVEQTLEGLDWLLNAAPPSLIILIVAFFRMALSGWKLTLFSVITLFFVGFLGLWEESMTTLAMVLSSVVFCAVVGVPLGIMAARSNRFETFLRPVLDAMQTTPAFVYLVPVVMLFSIGTVAGVIATIIFRTAPHHPSDQSGHTSSTA